MFNFNYAKMLVTMIFVLFIGGVILVNAQKNATPTPSPLSTLLSVPTNLPVPMPKGYKINCPRGVPKPCSIRMFTAKDYEIAINNPSEETKKAVLESIKPGDSFLSLEESQKRVTADRQTEKMKSLLAEKYFSSILNRDSVVGIENKLFRINPNKNLAFVMELTGKEDEDSILYGELVNENARNPKIKAYSLEEDVLDLVFNQSDSASTRNVESASMNKGLFCSQSGIGSKAATTGWLNINSSSNMIGSVFFNKFGIYFSLYADLQATLSIYKLGIEVQTVQYKPRCKSQVGPYNSFPVVLSGYNRFQSYQGSTNLNKMQLRARFHVYVGTNGTPVKTTNWIEIKTNY